MQISPVTPEQLNSSVIAVPPLARDAELKINREENGKIIRGFLSFSAHSVPTEKPRKKRNSLGKC